MQTALRINASVLSGHRIELRAPSIPEGTSVDVIITNHSVESFPRYPSLIEAAYDELIDKKLARTLTAEEACRLNEVRNVIAEIDRLTHVEDIRMIRLNQIETEVDSIRTQIEALPDA